VGDEPVAAGLRLPRADIVVDIFSRRRAGIVIALATVSVQAIRASLANPTDSLRAE